MAVEVEVTSTVHLSLASHSETQMKSSGNFLVEGTHFHLTSSKTRLRTSLGIEGAPAEAGAEARARSSLLSADFPPLEGGFLPLMQGSVPSAH